MAEGKKVIAVVGATGAQGGSVVKFLLKDGKYHVRGLTRKADSPAAQGAHAHAPTLFSLKIPSCRRAQEARR